jgi:putative protease
MEYARALDLPVHLSTQLNISNVESLSFYSRYADVVVLARELNLDQIRHITSSISERDISGPSGNLVRIELFCHGALCMSISGKCYLSLHAMDQSANRGACMQLCRRRYLVRDMDSDLELSVENPCIMSPKDLKTIHFLNHIIESGVSILKIEGRARSAEYVSEVTSCYREAIDAYAAGTYGAAKVAEWDKRLSTVFNRGFWDGYYLGRRLGEWSSSYGSASTKRKIYVGRVLKYYSHLGVGEFILESGALHVGDEIWITGPTTGALHQSITEIRIEDVPSAEVSKGIIFSMPTVSKIRPSDRVYLFA